MHVAHILIKIIDIDQWIIDQLALKSVIVGVGGFEWKSECGLVLDFADTCDDNNLAPYAPDELVEEDERLIINREDTDTTASEAE